MADSLNLKEVPIISLAKDPWEGNWFNRQHLISRISEANPVLHVSPPFNIRDAWRSFRQAEKVFSGLRRVTNNLYLYTPPRWLPYTYRSPMLNNVTARARSWQIRNALKSLRMTKPILYIWDPAFADMIGQFNERLVVYHCYDEHVDFPGVTEEERSTIESQERFILERADIVFAVSRSIAERKRQFNASIFIVRNAADYDLFAAARSPETKIPEEINSIPRPIVGCVTRIVDQYFNVPLMCEVFERRPDWSLVIIGPVIEPDGIGERAAQQKRDLARLKQLANVHLLGRREQRELPGYLKAFDVCTMAYPMIESVMHSESPLKMYEYLAAGKPVVSTPLPLISDLGDVIRFAGTADDWVSAIESALQDTSARRVVERQAIARENTWDQRASFISTTLAGELSLRER